MLHNAAASGSLQSCPNGLSCTPRCGIVATTQYVVPTQARLGKTGLLENGIAAVPHPLAGPRYIEGRKWTKHQLTADQPASYKPHSVQAPTGAANKVLLELRRRGWEVGPSTSDPYIEYGGKLFLWFSSRPVSKPSGTAQPDTFNFLVNFLVTDGARLRFWQLTPMGEGIEWTDHEEQPDPPQQVEWAGRLEDRDVSGKWHPSRARITPLLSNVVLHFTLDWPPLDLEAAGGTLLHAHQPQARKPGDHVQVLGRLRSVPSLPSQSQCFRF